MPENEYATPPAGLNRQPEPTVQEATAPNPFVEAIRERAGDHLADLVQASLQQPARPAPQIADPDNNIRYADIYPSLPDAQVLETHALCKVFWKLGKLSKDRQAEAVNRWIESMSILLNIERPGFFFVDDPMLYEMTGGGQYSPATHKIYAYGKMSLATLLHEFRHAWQNKRPEGANIYKDNMEEDARAWSMSLFRQASPRMYDNAVDKRLVFFA